MLPTPVILVIHQTSQTPGYISVLEKTGSKVHQVDSFEEANKLLSFLHPDLIVLASELDDGDGRLYCQQIRATLVHPRPVLVLLQPGNDVSERIASFRYGADDVLGDPIDSNELAFRVLAHLRRRQEELSNRLTQLPGPSLIRQMLEQCLVWDKPWAALSIDLQNLRVYNEAFGDLAGDQLIKAVGAILSGLAGERDFVGHIEADDFIMVTTPEKRELIAEKICSQFDLISQRFYPKEDIERGYLVAAGPGGIRRRVPLISLGVGIITNTTRRFQSSVDILTTAKDFRELAKQGVGSSWVDGSKFQLELKEEELRHSRILVVEPDGAMACLLQENLSLEGYFVQVTSSVDDALDIARREPHPDLILLESNFIDRGMDGWQLCRLVKEDKDLTDIWVVMATSHPDQSLALEAGADLYLPKPFDIPSLLSEVSLLLSTRIHQ